MLVNRAVFNSCAMICEARPHPFHPIEPLDQVEQCAQPVMTCP
jgi:hypothetical protein